MKTLDEHNKEKREAYRFLEEAAQKTGVSCPKCNQEMMFVDGNLRLSSPPQRAVKCKCGHHDFILA